MRSKSQNITANANVNPQTRVFLCGLLMAKAGYREFRDLAAGLNITPHYLSQIIRGDRRPAKYQRLIAEQLDIAPAELFGPVTHDSLRRRSS